MSSTTIIARMQDDGVLVRVLPDGSKTVMPASDEARPLSDADVQAAALADPDAQPITEASLARMVRVPRAKTLRRALGLTQEAFAARFQIPLSLLREWEQGTAAPDALAETYLRAIAGNAAAVEQALRAGPADR